MKTNNRYISSIFNDKSMKKELSSTLFKLMVCVLLVVNIIGSNLLAEEDSLLFWNKLGSIEELENSECGPACVYYGDVPFSPGMFGNGIDIMSRTGYAVRIPVEALSDRLFSKSWTIEFWYKPKYGMVNSRITGGTFRPRMTIFGADGAAPSYTEIGHFHTILIISYPIPTPSDFSQVGVYSLPTGIMKMDKLENDINWEPNTNVHIAFVYDADRTDGKLLRLYVDGVEHIYSDAPIPSNDPIVIPGNFLRLGTDWAITNRYAFGIIDNIKVWNYAKADFSDRFYEGGIVTATIDIRPDTLNLKSQGRWINCYIELPEDFYVGDIDTTTVLLNNTLAAEPGTATIGDYDWDGIDDILLKFNRSNVQNILSEGYVEIAISGEFFNSQTPFMGIDTVRVIHPGKKK